MTNSTHTALTFSPIESPLGTLIAIADEQALYFLRFVDSANTESKLARLQKKFNTPLKPGKTGLLRSIETELYQYFQGKRTMFTTPLCLQGSPFQQCVWNEIAKIPCGQTLSYAAIALAIDKPRAFRAVAQAAGANPCTLVIPCHRVITSDGKLGGYNSGMERKKWLLKHESPAF